MKTECAPVQIEFTGPGRRRVRGAFDGGHISLDGDAVLLREVDARLGITQKLAACFTDHRDPGLIEHGVTALVRQRVYGLALGYEDLNDHNDLKRDPLSAVALDKSDVQGEARQSSCPSARENATNSASCFCWPTPLLPMIHLLPRSGGEPPTLSSARRSTVSTTPSWMARVGVDQETRLVATGTLAAPQFFALSGIETDYVRNGLKADPPVVNGHRGRHDLAGFLEFPLPDLVTGTRIHPEDTLGTVHRELVSRPREGIMIVPCRRGLVDPIPSLAVFGRGHVVRQHIKRLVRQKKLARAIGTLKGHEQLSGCGIKDPNRLSVAEDGIEPTALRHQEPPHLGWARS